MTPLLIHPVPDQNRPYVRKPRLPHPLCPPLPRLWRDFQHEMERGVAVGRDSNLDKKYNFCRFWKIDLLLVMIKKRIVTKIEVQKRNPRRRSVFIDGKFAFGLDEEILYKFGLKKGESLTQRQIEKIAEEERRKEAKDVALRFLSFRRRTEKQVKEKLQKKGFDEKTIISTIDKLKGFDLINDLEFAFSWVKDRLAYKPRGKKLLKQELWKKGIRKDIIEQVTEELCQDEDKSVLQLLEKIQKRYKNLEPKVAKRRMYNLLLRRGFSYETTKKALSQVNRSFAEEEIY